MTQAAPVEVRNNEAEHRFEVEQDRQVAFAEYRLLASGIMFPHTLVPEALEGRGLAKAMAEEALAFARGRDLKVMPTCTFFAGYIAKHPEHHDLVHPDYRRALHLD
jgi:predicted GNAT family acetyltransferase